MHQDDRDKNFSILTVEIQTDPLPIDAHPCKKRKYGAPSVGMMHTKIAKVGLPASSYY